MNSENYLCLDGNYRPSPLVDSINPKNFDIELSTKITHGHGVASKAGKLYPAGTLELQYPCFKELGLDLGICHPGTLNLSIAPKKYSIHAPTFNLKDIDWYPPRGKTENFLFCDCAIKVRDGYILGHVYLPDPATKIEHYDDPHAIQIVSPFVPGLQDSGVVELFLKSSQCLVEG